MGIETRLTVPDRIPAHNVWREDAYPVMGIETRLVPLAGEYLLGREDAYPVMGIETCIPFRRLQRRNGA